MFGRKRLGRQDSSTQKTMSRIEYQSLTGLDSDEPVQSRGKFKDSICSISMLKKKLPILQWLPKYRVQNLYCDFIAGLTVSLTVIPQGLAYAKIARLPPQYGLYSAFMGCFIYVFLGTAKDITLGPTAILSLMTATFAQSPIKNDATYAIILSLMTGCVQLTMGVLNLGILVNFISYPVINAFTSAAAITIAFGELKSILGLKNIPRDFLKCVYYTFAYIGSTNVWDLTLGVSCLVLLYFIKKFRNMDWGNDSHVYAVQIIARKFLWLFGTCANAVIVISSAAIAAALLSQNLTGKLTLTGELKAGLPPFKLPAFSIKTSNGTITARKIFEDINTGFLIVPLLGLLEAVAIGKAFARHNNYKMDSTQEMVALGVANIMSSFVSSYPITGSFSRTALNSQSGVTTPAGGIVTGVIVLLTLQVLTPLFYYIPNAALAAIIISAVLCMIDVKIFIRLWKVQKWDLLPYLVTFISSLSIGIEYGIFIGTGVSLLMLLYPLSRPGIQIVRHSPVPVVQLELGLQFPAVEYLESKIFHLLDMVEEPVGIIVDCSHVYQLDYTAVQGITEIHMNMKNRGLVLALVNLQLRVIQILQEVEIPDLLICSSVEEGYQRLAEDLNMEILPAFKYS